MQRLLVLVINVALEGQSDAAAAWLRWCDRGLERDLEFTRFAKRSIYGAYAAFLRDHLRGIVLWVKITC